MPDIPSNLHTRAKVHIPFSSIIAVSLGLSSENMVLVANGYINRTKPYESYARNQIKKKNEKENRHHRCRRRHRRNHRNVCITLIVCAIQPNVNKMFGIR